MARVVYRNLAQVWDALRAHANSEQVKSLIALCSLRGLRGEEAGEKTAKAIRDPAHPFVVIEGLDGTGKTTLTKHLSEFLQMKLISTPPKIPEIQQARSYFDTQPESLRRAFYSLGNYLAAQDVLEAKQPVVMDRFWHSTAAYALAHQLKSVDSRPEEADFMWPEDLLKPDLVIFLQVSEEERIRRHRNRQDFTNTPEEKTLAEDIMFRKNLLNIYKNISGSNFLELNVDGEQAMVEQKILETVVEQFPFLMPAEMIRSTLPGSLFDGVK